MPVGLQPVDRYRLSTSPLSPPALFWLQNEQAGRKRAEEQLAAVVAEAEGLRVQLEAERAQQVRGSACELWHLAQGTGGAAGVFARVAAWDRTSSRGLHRKAVQRAFHTTWYANGSSSSPPSPPQ